MDEPQAAVPAQAGDGADASSVATTPVAETKTTGQTEQEPITTDPGNGNDASGQQEHRPSRIERRLHRLLERQEDTDSDGQTTDPNKAFSPSLPTPPWAPRANEGEEITQERYQQDVTRAGQEVAKLQVDQLRRELANERQWERTVTEIERAHPTLNPDATEYDEAISDRVTKLYKDAAGKQRNPKLLRSIVDGVMDLTSKARTEGQATVTAKLAEQAQEQAITPNSGKTKTGLSQEEMTELKRTNPGKLAKILAEKLPWSDD
jgi:hypothetical protein